MLGCVSVLVWFMDLCVGYYSHNFNSGVYMSCVYKGVVCGVEKGNPAGSDSESNFFHKGG